jgi:hypothetical protein
MRFKYIYLDIWHSETFITFTNHLVVFTSFTSFLELILIYKLFNFWFGYLQLPKLNSIDPDSSFNKYFISFLTLLTIILLFYMVV